MNLERIDDSYLIHNSHKDKSHNNSKGKFETKTKENSKKLKNKTCKGSVKPFLKFLFIKTISIYFQTNFLIKFFGCNRCRTS